VAVFLAVDAFLAVVVCLLAVDFGFDFWAGATRPMVRRRSSRVRRYMESD